MNARFPVVVTDCALGKGVFASRDIAAGEFVLEFTGTHIVAGTSASDVNPNHLQIGAAQYLALDSPGIFVNHSCGPNCGIICDTRLVALRDIKQHEQILYDYSTTMSDGSWTMDCACGHESCRSVIQDFHFLPRKLREEYLRLGIVQRFIADQWRQNRKATLASHQFR